MATREKADAVIVGAGAAGAVFAAVLSRAGKHVVVLEQGPDWQLSDLISSDIWARRLRGSGPAIVYEGRHPVGRTADHGWGTGGAALHYSANFPRLLPSDFNMKSEHGRGLDGPISYTDIAPLRSRRREIGVSGDAKAEERGGRLGPLSDVRRSRRFAMAGVLGPGFGRSASRLRRVRSALTALEYQGRAACIHDGWCGAGCPTGALANPQATYLGEARAKGAEVRAMSYVTRILTNAQGTRVTAVEYFDGKKERQVQEASLVVLAAFASQNPRLMFNSATDKHPNGLANASGLLGNYVMAHAGAGVSAIFDEDLQNYLGSFGYQFVSYDRHPKTSRKTAFGSTFWNTGAAQKPTDLRGIANVRPDLIGKELDEFLKGKSRGLSRITAICEALPKLENRIDLAPEKDEFGFPLVRINHTFDQDAVGLWNAALDEGVEIAKGAGAKEIWPGRGGIAPQHLLGGTIMGTSTGIGCQQLWPDS
jgi:choline dehydrogenase-like flavoprotein